jgi:hypothetical protein
MDRCAATSLDLVVFRNEITLLSSPPDGGPTDRDIHRKEST